VRAPPRACPSRAESRATSMLPSDMVRAPSRASVSTNPILVKPRVISILSRPNSAGTFQPVSTRRESTVQPTAAVLCNIRRSYKGRTEAIRRPYEGPQVLGPARGGLGGWPPRRKARQNDRDTEGSGAPRTNVRLKSDTSGFRAVTLSV
jgi:hypothetical protein